MMKQSLHVQLLCAILWNNLNTSVGDISKISNDPPSGDPSAWTDKASAVRFRRCLNFQTSYAGSWLASISLTKATMWGDKVFILLLLPSVGNFSEISSMN